MQFGWDCMELSVGGVFVRVDFGANFGGIRYTVCSGIDLHSVSPTISSEFIVEVISKSG